MALKSFMMRIDSIVGGSGILAGMTAPGRVATVRVLPVPSKDDDVPGDGSGAFEFALTPAAVAKYGLRHDQVLQLSLDVVDEKVQAEAIAAVEAAVAAKG